MTDWHEKPYYSLDAYCKNTYGHKLYKIALNAHFTCPNRDGTLGFRGCLFCSAGGSGEFATPLFQNDADEARDAANGVQGEGNAADDVMDLGRQLEEGLALFGQKKVGEEFIAYFQAYTNTYGPLSHLERLYRSALMHPKIRGISIATRPDCVGDPVISLLDKLRGEFPDKFIWIELGLQTINERTAEYIRRGYRLPVFEDAFERLKAAKIPVIVHLILGLPGETKEDMLESVQWVSDRHPFGIKLQLLHVLKHTDLATEYLEGKFEVLGKDEYIDLVAECIALLSEDVVIHRVTGDGAGKDLIAPDWSRNKKAVLNELHHRLKEKGIRQGCHVINRKL